MTERKTPRLELIINNADKHKEGNLRINLTPSLSIGTNDWSENDPEEGYPEGYWTDSRSGQQSTQRKHMHVVTSADAYRISDNKRELGQLFKQADRWFLKNNPFRYCYYDWQKLPLNHSAILWIMMPKNSQIEYFLMAQTLSISDPGRVLNSKLFVSYPLPFTPPLFHEMASSLGEAATHIAQQIKKGTNLYLYFKDKHVSFEKCESLSLQELGNIRSLDKRIFNTLKRKYIENYDISKKIHLAYLRGRQ